ncbi:hypothetical protein BKA69DRAFT_1122462 [Paraphysoderma sedebokerense]|nr:hypothetical protein BKA69DRAFT_1122462 [Paraphysoderma sedebokerense]
MYLSFSLSIILACGMAVIVSVSADPQTDGIVGADCISLKESAWCGKGWSNGIISRTTSSGRTFNSAKDFDNWFASYLIKDYNVRIQDTFNCTDLAGKDIRWLIPWYCAQAIFAGPVQACPSQNQTTNSGQALCADQCKEMVSDMEKASQNNTKCTGGLQTRNVIIEQFRISCNLFPWNGQRPNCVAVTNAENGTCPKSAQAMGFCESDAATGAVDEKVSRQGDNGSLAMGITMFAIGATLTLLGTCVWAGLAWTVWKRGRGKQDQSLWLDSTSRHSEMRASGNYSSEPNNGNIEVVNGVLKSPISPLGFNFVTHRNPFSNSSALTHQNANQSPNQELSATQTSSNIPPLLPPKALGSKPDLRIDTSLHRLSAEQADTSTSTRDHSESDSTKANRSRQQTYDSTMSSVLVSPISPNFEITRLPTPIALSAIPLSPVLINPAIYDDVPFGSHPVCHRYDPQLPDEISLHQHDIISLTEKFSDGYECTSKFEDLERFDSLSRSNGDDAHEKDNDGKNEHQKPWLERSYSA